MYAAVYIRSEEEMGIFGTKLAQYLRAGDAVLLSGEMGTGKSVLARSIARAFGVKGAMPSPSFTILLSYEGVIPVKHFDLYRLEDPAEFFEAGLDEEIDKQSLSIVEWPEMTDYVPANSIRVHITRGEKENERMLELDADDGRFADFTV